MSRAYVAVRALVRALVVLVGLGAPIGGVLLVAAAAGR